MLRPGVEITGVIALDLAALVPSPVEKAKGERAKMIDRLASAGLRATHTRKALAALLFNSENRHVTAEQLHREAMATTKISLATIYNTLHAFTRSGLLQEVLVEPGRCFFDTNVTQHYHFYFEETHALLDIPVEIVLLRLPAHPCGTTISRVDLIIRVRSAKEISEISGSTLA
jgi:Fur family iron response transcriptional regulator